MDLHPNCVPLAFLLGAWQGPGQGSYPTIESFGYLEEVRFAHVGKPFLAYQQKTRSAETSEPLHAESGYLRAIGENKVEFVIVQPSGIVELHHGVVNGTSIELTLDAVHTTASAKSVSEVQRSFHVAGHGEDRSLIYDVAMAAVGEPLTHHLHAELVHQAGT